MSPVDVSAIGLESRRQCPTKGTPEEGTILKTDSDFLPESHVHHATDAFAFRLRELHVVRPLSRPATLCRMGTGLSPSHGHLSPTLFLAVPLVETITPGTLAANEPMRS